MLLRPRSAKGLENGQVVGIGRWRRSAHQFRVMRAEVARYLRSARARSSRQPGQMTSRFTGGMTGRCDTAKAIREPRVATLRAGRCASSGATVTARVLLPTSCLLRLHRRAGTLLGLCAAIGMGVNSRRLRFVSRLLRRDRSSKRRQSAISLSAESLTAILLHDNVRLASSKVSEP